MDNIEETYIKLKARYASTLFTICIIISAAIFLLNKNIREVDAEYSDYFEAINYCEKTLQKYDEYTLRSPSFYENYLLVFT